MKTGWIILLMCITINLISCKKSSETIMKDKIEEHYTSKANEALFENYDPISFSAIDTIYSSIETSSDYVDLTNLSNKISLKINEIVFKRNSGVMSKQEADKKLKLLYDRLEQVSANKETIKHNFKRSVIGYSMKHTFRIKNKVANKDIQPTILIIYHDNLLIKEIVVLKE